MLGEHVFSQGWPCGVTVTAYFYLVPGILRVSSSLSARSLRQLSSLARESGSTQLLCFEQLKVLVFVSVKKAWTCSSARSLALRAFNR